MILRSIRSRLLGLVLAAVVPFTALIGIGLWAQWQDVQSAAIAQTVNEARVLAAQVDDHIGNLEHLLTGLSLAVSTNPGDASANDTLLRRAKAELPGFFIVEWCCGTARPSGFMGSLPRRQSEHR